MNNEWKEVKLKYLIDKMGDGGTPSTLNQNNFGGEIPWVVVEDIRPEIYDTKTKLTETGLRSCSAKLWPIDSVILSTGATIGEVGIAKVSLCTKQGITGLVCNEFTNNYYLKFWLEHNRNTLFRYSQGTTFKEIRTRPLGNLRIKIPSPFTNESVIEQKAIAGILSKVDEAIEAVKNSIKAEECLKKSLIQNLLTGKLKPDGTWRSKDEFYVDGKFDKVPKGWEIEKIKNLTNRVTDGEHLSPDFQSSGAYLLSAEDVFDDGISFEKAKFVRSDDCRKFRKRCDPDFGDVLIVSRGAGIGRTCKVNQNIEFCLMGSVILIKPKNEILHGGYLSQYFKSYSAWVELQKLSGTTAQQAIYLTHINKVKLMYPSDIAEQKDISEFLEKFDSDISSKQSKIQSLKTLKKSLMQNLLTGKVRVDVEKINKLLKEV